MGSFNSKMVWKTYPWQYPLHGAVYYEDEERVRRLLRRNNYLFRRVEVNEMCRGGFTPLLIAAHKGNAMLVLQFIPQKF